MKTIKIFLASSEELTDDRNAFGNLVRRLNKIYEKRGIHIDLFEWEDYDAAYNNRRKQEEYNEKVRESDMFLSIFHRVAGRFTIEEFEVAIEQFCCQGSPKIYTYCKDLKPGEIETPELTDFKRRLLEEIGHYWNHYANRDTMQLHFVMQLQYVESVGNNVLKIEDGNVIFDECQVARVESLPFAYHNEDFQNMNHRLSELPILIEKKKLKTEQYPDDEDFVNELQNLIDEYNDLKERFNDYQIKLFEVAKNIASLQGSTITKRIRRAIETFNNGLVREANIILDEAELDGTMALKEYKCSKEITEHKRENVIGAIAEMQLKATTTMADESKPIDTRVDTCIKLYDQIDDMANEIQYDPIKYLNFLSNYGTFIEKYSLNKKLVDIRYKAISIAEKYLGMTNHKTFSAYYDAGYSHYLLGDYQKALSYSTKALDSLNKLSNSTNIDFWGVHNNLGLIYFRFSDFARAIEHYTKAINFNRESKSNIDELNNADTFCNIGLSLYFDNKGSMALEYFYKALEIETKILDQFDIRIANTYSNIGLAYSDMGEFQKALEFHNKALDIKIKTLGRNNKSTAISYGNIGCIYSSLNDYLRALQYLTRALNIMKQKLGNHPDCALLYYYIGSVYYDMYEPQKAIKSYEQALNVQELKLGKDHHNTLATYNGLAKAYECIGNQSMAFEYRAKGFSI